MKTHYKPTDSTTRSLYCSGRYVEIAFHTSDVSEVTCGACARKLAKAAS